MSEADSGSESDTWSDGDDDSSGDDYNGAQMTGAPLDTADMHTVEGFARRAQSADTLHAAFAGAYAASVREGYEHSDAGNLRLPAVVAQRGSSFELELIEPHSTGEQALEACRREFGTDRVAQVATGRTIGGRVVRTTPDDGTVRLTIDATVSSADAAQTAFAARAGADDDESDSDSDAESSSDDDSDADDDIAAGLNEQIGARAARNGATYDAAWRCGDAELVPVNGQYCVHAHSGDGAQHASYEFGADLRNIDAAQREVVVPLHTRSEDHDAVGTSSKPLASVRLFLERQRGDVASGAVRLCGVQLECAYGHRSAHRGGAAAADQAMIECNRAGAGAAFNASAYSTAVLDEIRRAMGTCATAEDEPYTYDACIVHNGEVIGAAGADGGAKNVYRLGTVTRTLTAAATLRAVFASSRFPEMDLVDANYVLHVLGGRSSCMSRALRRVYKCAGAPLPTLHQLLTHTAGLPTFFQFTPDAVYKSLHHGAHRTAKQLSQKRIARSLCRIELICEPGARVHESHVGYALVGMMARALHARAATSTLDALRRFSTPGTKLASLQFDAAAVASDLCLVGGQGPCAESVLSASRGAVGTVRDLARHVAAYGASGDTQTDNALLRAQAQPAFRVSSDDTRVVGVGWSSVPLFACDATFQNRAQAALRRCTLVSCVSAAGTGAHQVYMAQVPELNVGFVIATDAPAQAVGARLMVSAAQALALLYTKFDTSLEPAQLRTVFPLANVRLPPLYQRAAARSYAAWQSPAACKRRCEKIEIMLEHVCTQTLKPLVRGRVGGAQSVRFSPFTGDTRHGCDVREHSIFRYEFDKSCDPRAGGYVAYDAVRDGFCLLASDGATTERLYVSYATLDGKPTIALNINGRVYASATRVQALHTRILHHLYQQHRSSDPDRELSRGVVACGTSFAEHLELTHAPDIIGEFIEPQLLASAAHAIAADFGGTETAAAQYVQENIGARMRGGRRGGGGLAVARGLAYAFGFNPWYGYYDPYYVYDNGGWIPRYGGRGYGRRRRSWYNDPRFGRARGGGGRRNAPRSAPRRVRQGRSGGRRSGGRRSGGGGGRRSGGGGRRR